MVLSNNGLIASGVTSLGESPVPPVKITIEKPFFSLESKLFCICSMLSGITE